MEVAEPVGFGEELAPGTAGAEDTGAADFCGRTATDADAEGTTTTGVGEGTGATTRGGVDDAAAAGPRPDSDSARAWGEVCPGHKTMAATTTPTPIARSETGTNQER